MSKPERPSQSSHTDSHTETENRFRPFHRANLATPELVLVGWRDEFLRRLKEIAFEETLGQLRSDVYPAYTEAAESNRASRSALREWDSLDPPSQIDDQWAKPLANLRLRLEEWSHGMALGAENFTGKEGGREVGRAWLLSVALRTMHQWHTYLALAEDPDWNYMGFGYWAPLRPEERTVEFTTTWESFHTPKSLARERILARFTQQLDSRLDEIEALTKARGWVKPPEKRTDEHLDWLVRSHVLRWSKPRIRREYRTDDKRLSDSTLDDGLNSAASLILLRRRRGRRGRPRKTPG